MIYYGKSEDAKPTFYKQDGTTTIAVWNLIESSQINILYNDDYTKSDYEYIDCTEQEFNEAFNIAMERIKTI